MGIITAFVIIAVDVILWLLPVQGAIQAFRTDEITNTFTVSATVSGNATAILSEDLFNANTSLITVTSDNSSETPTVAGYEATTKTVTVAGLTPSQAAILTIVFFVDAFANEAVWSTVLNLAPFLFILVLCILPVIAAWLFIQEIKNRHR